MIQFLMRTLLACCLLSSAAAGTAATADQDENAIRETVRLYLHGTSFNVQDEIKQAFHANSRLYLDGKDDTEWELSGAEYAKLFTDEKKGQFNGRHGRLIKVDMNGKVATAKAVYPFPGWK